MPLSPPVKQLLVDLDGTLLGNRNLPLSIDFVSQAMTMLKKYGGWKKSAQALFAVQKEFGKTNAESSNAKRVVELFSKRMSLTQEEGLKVIRDGLSVIFPKLERHFYPVPGALDFLDWAKDRFPMILATNPVWPTEIIEMRVRWAGIDPKIFQDITDVRKMHSCKPKPEYYREILSQHKLKAEDCLLIGNEVKMDLPATRVGIRTFIVGQYKTVQSVTFPGGKAQAWRGSFSGLRKLLEDTEG